MNLKVYYVNAYSADEYTMMMLTTKVLFLMLNTFQTQQIIQILMAFLRQTLFFFLILMSKILFHTWLLLTMKTHLLWVNPAAWLHSPMAILHRKSVLTESMNLNRV